MLMIRSGRGRRIMMLEISTGPRGRLTHRPALFQLYVDRTVSASNFSAPTSLIPALF
jgi:hypothetical protein